MTRFVGILFLGTVLSLNACTKTDAGAADAEVADLGPDLAHSEDGGTTLPPDQGRWAGSRALIWDKGSVSTLTYENLGQQLLAAGASGVDHPSVWPESISSYAAIFLMAPGSLSDQALQQLAEARAQGAGIVITKEALIGASLTEVNRWVKVLGVNASFDDQGSDVLSGCNNLHPKISHPLTAGVEYVTWASGRPIKGAPTVLFGTEKHDLIGLEGTVLLCGDTQVFADEMAAGDCDHQSDYPFYQNLFKHLPQ